MEAIDVTQLAALKRLIFVFSTVVRGEQAGVLRLLQLNCKAMTPCSVPEPKP